MKDWIPEPDKKYYSWQIINHSRPRIKMKEVYANHPFGMYHYITDEGIGLLEFLLSEVQWRRNMFGYITETQRLSVEKMLKANLFMLYEL